MLPRSMIARRLAAILAADVVGYSRLMGADEAGTAKSVRESREAAGPIIATHSGRMFKTMGDGYLVEFGSVVSAVECALALQAETARLNETASEAKRLSYRMGIHLGDVLVEGEDLVGDGVNIAARLEQIAAPGGVCISRTVYENVKGRIEARLTDLGEKSLKNIAQPVRAYAVDPAPGGAGDLQSPSTARNGRAARISMVVLPFANLGGGAEQEYFVDGVTESLTTDLSRISSAFVIARNTAFAYKGKPVDIRQIGQDLNVRYVLEGSVQRSGERMRVNTQLIDAETGAHLWAERFDKPVAELFDMQDEIVARIANQLSAQIVRVEARRAEKASSPDLLDYWFRGYDWINKGINPESLAKARECFQRARAIDPDNVNAMLGLVLTDVISTPMRSFDDNPKRLAEARALILKALTAEPGNASAHYCLGLILLFSTGARAGDRRAGAVAVARPQLRLRPRPDRLRQGRPRPRRGDGGPCRGGDEAQSARFRRLCVVRFPRRRRDHARPGRGGAALVPQGGGDESRLSDRPLSLRRRARPLRADRRSPPRSCGRAQARA